MRTLLLIFCIAVFGCVNNKFDKIQEQTFKEVDNLDKTALMNFTASVRSRDRDSDKIIVTNYYSSVKGAVLLKIDEKCDVLETDYMGWNNFPKLDLTTTKLISKCLCEIGLCAISVDSCGNTYFSVTQVDQYEFVIIENQSCLDNKLTYGQCNGNFCRIK